MTLKRIVDLPQAQLPLTGAELIEIVQNGISAQASFTGIFGFSVNIRQVKSALVTEGVFYEIAQAVPADPGNLTNIQWSNGESISANDPLYTLIMTTLGYDGNQMAALLSLAATLPR